MTPDRAIEVVGEDGLESGEGTWEEYLAAIQLGREALKRLQELRRNSAHNPKRLIPGETEEDRC